MKHVVVVGAGVVGLSTAWHLQELDYEVTVIDRVGVGAGSSWGNAGWLTPGKAIPLAHPSLWTYGAKALFDPKAALSVPVRVDAKLWKFVAAFLAHANPRSWDKTMAALTPIDKLALEAFDEMTDSDVDSWTQDGPFIVGFEQESQSKGFREEIAGAIRHGQHVPFERLDNPQEVAPQLSKRVTAAFRLEGQRFLEPAPFVEALAEAFLARGGKIIEGQEVEDISSTRKPVVSFSSGERCVADAVVVATGAWLPKLTRKLGVRTMVQAGRGYSFTVESTQPAKYPVYLPHERLACTPYQGRFRIGGTMEFRGPDEPFQPQRIEAMVHHSGRLLANVNLQDRQDEWVGSRPVTPDGLPLVGTTKAPNVYVAGGHGMWGVVLGPITGKLLAQQIDTGVVHPAIAPFDPLR